LDSEVVTVVMLANDAAKERSWTHLSVIEGDVGYDHPSRIAHLSKWRDPGRDAREIYDIALRYRLHHCRIGHVPGVHASELVVGREFAAEAETSVGGGMSK
jgi:hypothetical protein